MTNNEFLDVLRQSKVLSAEQWTVLRTEILLLKAKGLLRRSGSIAAITAAPPETPQELAQRLIDRDWLTRWQADMLLLRRPTLFLGKYRLLECIGAGGMGAVFKAQQGKLGRTVALKVMANDIVQNPRAIARFRKEIQAAAALDHPHIVAAYDADCVQKVHFLVMEYVEGHDLGWYVNEQGRQPIGFACECIRQAALGLQHAHECGMVHRDIKPTNLLVARDDEADHPLVKVLDLGLARFTTDDGADETGLASTGLAHASLTQSGLTQAGQVLGSPDYMAPEQAADTRRADARSDIFSLGCTLFRLLTGEVPFPGDSVADKISARQNGTPRRLSQLRPEVPAALRKVVKRMMARNPDDRYQSALEVAEALLPFCGAGELPAPAAPGTPEVRERSSAASLLPLGDSRLMKFFDHLETRGDHERPTRTTRARINPRRRRDGWRHLARRALAARKRLALAAGIVVFLAVWGLWQWVAQVTLVVELPPEARRDWSASVDGKPVAIPADGPLVVVGRSGEWDLRLARPGYEPVREALSMTFGEWRVLAPEWRATSVTLRQQALDELKQRASGHRRADPLAEPVVALRQAALDFRSKFAGTVEAAGAVRLLAELPAPLDRLDRGRIDKTALRLARGEQRSIDQAPLAGILGDGQLMFWDRVTSIAVSHDGRLVAAAGLDGTVRIFDRIQADQNATLSIRHVLPLGFETRQLAFSPVDDTLAIAGDRHEVFLCQAGDGEKVESLGRLGAPLAFSPRGHWIAATVGSGQIAVYETATRRLDQSFVDRSARECRALVFSPDETRLAVATADHSVALRDLGRDVDPLRLENAQFPVFSPDGSLLATSSTTGDLVLWDCAAGKPQRTFPKGGQPIEFAPDQTTLISNARDRVIVWDLESGVNRREMIHVPPQCLVSPDGTRLAAADRKNLSLRLWNLETGSLLSAVDLSAPITALAFTAESTALVSGDARGAIREWDIAEDELKSVDTTWGLVAGSPDGRYAAIASSGTVALWDLVEPGSPPIRLEGSARGLDSLDWSPHGRVIAGAGGPGETGGLRLWDVDLQRGAALPVGLKAATASRLLRFNPTGLRLVTDGEGSSLTIWETSRLAALESIDALEAPPEALALDDERRWLAAADREGHAVLWNLSERRPVALETPLHPGIRNLDFSPGGRHLVAASDSGVLTWDVSSGKPTRVLACRTENPLLAGKPTSLRFSPAGDRLAAVGDCGRVWIWNWKTGEVPSEEPDVVYKIGPSRGLVERVYWSADGRHLLTVNRNCTLYVLRLPSVRTSPK